MKLEWKSCFKIGVTAVAAVLCIMFLPRAGALLLTLLSAGTPLIVGCIIAYLVNIIMTGFEKIYFPRARASFLINSRRPVCLLLAFLSLAAIMSLVATLVIPQLTSCIALIIDQIPGVINSVAAFLEEKEILTEDVVNQLLTVDWQSRISQIFKVVTSGIGGVLNIVIGTLSSIFSGLVTALIAVIFSIYLLSGKERIGAQLRRLMNRYVKPSLNGKISHILSTLNDCFRRYIIGQCTEALILGALCALGMWALRMPYAAMVGALVAFTALIPVAGAYIGAFVGAFMILTVSPAKAVLFVIFLVILQQLEGNIIYPRVVGSSIGLPGVWVLAAVTVGGGTLGIPGMLLGVPLAAAVYRLLREDVTGERFDKTLEKTEKKPSELPAEASRRTSSKNKKITADKPKERKGKKA